MLIERIRQGARSQSSCIQIDTSYMMSAVWGEGEERPYYPRLCMLADKESGQLLGLEMYQGSDNDAQVTLGKLIGICLQQGAPSEVHVRSELMKAILGDFCKKAGIKLKKLKRLAAIDYAMEELMHRFSL